MLVQIFASEIFRLIYSLNLLNLLSKNKEYDDYCGAPSNLGVRIHS